MNATIRELLGLTYPEFEVIVGRGCARSRTSTGSHEEWQLESREFFYRRTLDTAPVRRIFRSVRDARLMVVEKDPDHRSDALELRREPRAVPVRRRRAARASRSTRPRCFAPWRQRSATRCRWSASAAMSSAFRTTRTPHRWRGTLSAAALDPLTDVHAAVLGTPAARARPGRTAWSSGGATRCFRRMVSRRMPSTPIST